jgi:hypothetical protein
MPEEKSSSYLGVKELGSLREKIIFHLSENPNLNAQALQKDLGYPSNQYPNILNALKTLEKLDLISSTSGKSKKNVPIRLYHCTLNGIFYALAKNPNANALNTLNAYQSLDNVVNSFLKLYDVWGHDLFIKFVRDVHEFLPMIHKDGVENVIPYMLMRMTMQMSDLDLNTRTRIAKETMKQFPHTKRIMKDWVKSVSKLF